MRTQLPSTDSQVSREPHRAGPAPGIWTVVLALVLVFANGCAIPVGVTRLDEQAAHRELNANFLSTGKPSDYSTQLLERTALADRFKSDPRSVVCIQNLIRMTKRDKCVTATRDARIADSVPACAALGV